MMYISNFTKDTALGHYYTSKYMKSKNVSSGSNNEKKVTFDPKSKNGWEMFRTFAKQFKEK